MRSLVYGVLACFLLLYENSTAQESEWKEYHNTENHFSFRYPAILRKRVDSEEKQIFFEFNENEEKRTLITLKIIPKEKAEIYGGGIEYRYHEGYWYPRDYTKTLYPDTLQCKEPLTSGISEKIIGKNIYAYHYYNMRGGFDSFIILMQGKKAIAITLNYDVLPLLNPSLGDLESQFAWSDAILATFSFDSTVKGMRALCLGKQY